MEVGERDRSFAVATCHQHSRVECSQCDAHVGGMGRDAMLACTKNCVHAIEPLDRRTAASRLALVTGRRGVVKIRTTSALQKISRRARHVAQLRRGSGEYRTAQQGIARLDLGVVGEIAIWNESADA